ncbi:hypothetical protein [Endozoicomonas sp. SESOKO1]|uniref:hypothetical protein n=1 Tax=Endozoicomonas sp. SESOKO1 TaxID=2828742 RepID=UPI002148AC6C|nr:hypothetical protein [Endozoicomonas sp. SESOKO1]
MSSPQFPTQSPAYFPQPSDASASSGASGSGNGGGANTTTAKFNSRDVTVYDMRDFFKRMTRGEVRELTTQTCAEAEREHGDKIWNKSNLERVLNTYELPIDFSRRDPFKDRKSSAVLNVFQKVIDECEQASDRGGEGHTLPLTQNLHNLLNRKPVKEGEKTRDSHFVTMDFFVGKMNRLQQKKDAENSASGSPGQERQLQERQLAVEPGLPPAENPTFKMEGHPPLPSVSAPTMTPSAPPNYDAVQAETKLAALNAEIAILQQGVLQDFQSHPFQNQLSWVQLEIAKLGVNLPANLQDQYGQAKATLDGLQQQQLGLNEQVMINAFHGQIDGLEQSLAQKQPKTDNKREVQAFDRDVVDLCKRIDKLCSTESESGKAVLRERVDAFKASIAGWLTVAAAFNTLKGLKSDLNGFQFQKSPQEVDSFSTKLDELDESIGRVPSGEQRIELMRESSNLRSSFSDIQKSVNKQHLIAKLETAEKTIKALEHNVSTNPESYRVLVEQARSALAAVTLLVVDEGRDDNLAILSNFRERLEKFEAPGLTGQAAASKMQSSARGERGERVEIEEVVARIDDLIADADSRLSVAEKMRKAVDTIPLNQTHMDEIQGILDQINEKILHVKGLGHRDERNRLLTMYCSLLSRLTGLQEGGEANSGQSTARTNPAVSGNQHQTLNRFEKSGDQGQMPAVEAHPEVLLQQGVAAYEKEMAAFGKKGTASQAGFAAATSNMAALLSKFASSQSEPTASQTVSSQAVTQPLVRQHVPLFPEPMKIRPVITHGDSLASFASQLGYTKTTIFDDRRILNASLGIKPSSEKIKSLVTSTDIPLKSLPSEIRGRMIEAFNDSNNWPEKIKLVQVYAFAPDESDFHGASFKVELQSLMPDYHREIYRRSSVRDQYSPIGADLRMPEGLKQGSKFYEVHWSVNESLAGNMVHFAHGSAGDNHGVLENIGFTLVAPVLKALGASAEEATSAEAGFGIPFGIDLRMQPQSVLQEVERFKPHRVVRFEVPDVTDSVTPDGGQLDSNVVSDAQGSSGINPLALQTQSKYESSSRIPASKIFAKEVGILWVKTVTGLPDINSAYGLMDWVGRNKPDLENLRLPQLL